MDQTTVTSAQVSSTETITPSSALSHTLLYCIVGGVVCFVGLIAALLCRAQMQDREYDIMLSHRTIEQTWLDSTVETVDVWNRELLENVRAVSRAEMIRMYVKDSEEGAGEDGAKDVKDYMHGLLLDTVNRRGWLDARILAKNGQVLVAAQDMQQDIAENQKAEAELVQLCDMARSQRNVSFSLPRQVGGHLLLDIVDPLYEVMGQTKPAIVGFLHVVVPIESFFTELLSVSRVQGPMYTPLLVAEGKNARGEDRTVLVELVQGKAVCQDISVPMLDKSLPFARRDSLRAEVRDVWSSGIRVSFLPWLLSLECDAAAVENEIFLEARQTYSIGVLGSLAIALVLAIFVGTRVVRQKAEEEQRCIGGLVHAIECALDGADAKFRYLQGRSHNVAALSQRVAKQMHLSAKSRENIQLAARLSQVGKIFVPRDIMIKRGFLTEEERRQVQLAPYHAFNVLKGVLPTRVARIIYQMGGKVIDDPATGANHDLTKSEMLLEARVLLVANVFCAMVSQRGTRPPLPFAEARKKLSESDLYDADVVTAINAISDDEIRTILGMATGKATDHEQQPA